jgi:hypothetical protein
MAEGKIFLVIQQSDLPGVPPEGHHMAYRLRPEKAGQAASGVIERACMLPSERPCQDTSGDARCDRSVHPRMAQPIMG